MSVIWVTRDEALGVVKGKVARTETVLDIGPGIRPQSYFRPHVHICVEPYLPYISRLREQVGNDPVYVFLNCTWQRALRLLPDKSVDSVFALDVIEHVEKHEGSALLEQAERVARRQIMLFTPLGLYPQDYDEAHPRDRWGMDGGYWQAHRSGWHLEDFAEGWDVVCCEAYHPVDQHEQPLENPWGAIWAFRHLRESGAEQDAGQPGDAWRTGRAANAFRRGVVGKLKRMLAAHA